MEQNKEKKGLLSGFFASSKWDSKITKANTSGKELWLGYILGPYGFMLIQSIVNSYYNSYLTDVVGFDSTKGAWILGFMVAFPVVAKIIDAITNIIMSKILDSTRCRQGKLRPWMILSAPVMVICTLLLFWVPNTTPIGQAAWIGVAYTLFYAVGYTMWYMPTEMSPALSTINVVQRSKLSMGYTIMRNVGTGLVSILFPTLLSTASRIANGDNGKGYFLCISVLCLIAIPLVFVQYFYTRERVTESRRQANTSVEKTKDETSLVQQLKIGCKNKYWIIFMIVLFISQLLVNVRNMSLIYYSGWVVNGNAYGNVAAIQAKFQMIALSPMGPGILLLLPLVKKWGRTKAIWTGAILTVLGSIVAFMGAGNGTIIYAGSALAAIGNLAFSYVFQTFLGDVLDHVEYKQGKRIEGITSAINGICFTVTIGLAMGIFNLGLISSGYIQPEQIGVAADGILLYADQAQSAINWINIAYQGSFIISGAIFLFVFLFLFDIEKTMPEVEAELENRKIAKCKELGVEYVSYQEQSRIEREEALAEIEKMRIEDLKEKCAKKGLDFETENKKYLDKQAKKEAKKSKKK